MNERPLFEADVIKGIHQFAMEELQAAGAKFVSAIPIRFKFGKSLTRLRKLRVVSQVFAVYKFGIPRPKALLGQQHFDRLLAILQNHIQEIGAHEATSFRLEAAGKDSAVFRRIIQQLESRLKLPYAPDGGDLFIRVKPAEKRGKGWEVLVRLTPRPLTARPWREFNYPGALAAPLAAVMHNMGNVTPHSSVLNIMCGSGSLLAELDGSQPGVCGCDLNAEALQGAVKNIKAAGNRANLQQANALHLPYKTESFDVILADLPWGQLIGESGEMDRLYAGTLEEAWRVCQPNGRFVVITQLKKRFTDALVHTPWQPEDAVYIQHQKVKPTIYSLRKPAF